MEKNVHLSRDPRVVTSDVKELKSYVECNISAEQCMKNIESNNKSNGCRFKNIDHFVYWASSIGWNRQGKQ
ncbi:MAG: hypothetical protein RR598_06540 [Anaerorhabdus sp.]|uniref:hypothetical protein n=1 Tax=Anaerorhabdus sp. TaxID=1872524 RepID=UPI002FC9F57C